MIQKISLFCLIAIIISSLYLNQGCKVEIFEPTPTPTLIPTATPTLTPTSTPAPTLTPTPSIPEAYLTSARKALEALQAIQSCTTTGISYVNYSSKKVDAQIAVDQFLKSNFVDYIAGLKNNIEMAMNNYTQAGERWYDHIEYDAPESLLQDKWRDADYYVNESARLLNDATKPK